MSAAEHAGNILSALIVADQPRFAEEVANARAHCDGTKGEEFERHELLTSIADQLEAMRAQKCLSSAKLHASFYLLYHLATLPRDREEVSRMRVTNKRKLEFGIKRAKRNSEAEVKAVRQGQ